MGKRRGNILHFAFVLILMALGISACQKKADPSPIPPQPSSQPTFTGFSPASGEAGSPVVMGGVFPDGSDIAVWFNGESAEILTRTTTQLVVKVPALAISGKIAIDVGDLFIRSQQSFKVLPRITAISTLVGIAGTKVSLTGTGFDPADCLITFNDSPAVPTTISHTKIETSVPVGAMSGFVSVSVNGTSYAFPDRFTVIRSAANQGGSDYSSIAVAVAVDRMGNSYVAGNLFLGNTTIGGVSVTPFGGSDIYVMKFNANLEVVWVKHIGGVYNDQVNDLVIDEAGDIYIAGYTGQGAAFGSLTASSHFQQSAFIAKMNPSGNFLWLADTGNDSWSEMTSINVDNSGNVFATGSFTGSIIFGSQQLYGFGNLSGFVVRYSSLDGGILNSSSLSGTVSTALDAITSDMFGNVYLTGSFKGSLTLGSTTLDGFGYGDFFVTKLNSSLTPVWASHIGGAESDLISDLGLDFNGNVYIAGLFTSSVSIAGRMLTAPGPYGGYVARLNGFNGNTDWATTVTTNSISTCDHLSISQDGTVYVIGLFSGDATIGPTTLTSQEPYSDLRDTYIAKLDPMGNPLWAISAGGPEIYSNALVAEGTTLYIAGEIANSASFMGMRLSTNHVESFIWKVSF